MSLSSLDRYLFDTLGFAVIKNVLTAEELSLVNSGIERRAATDFFERKDGVRNSAIGSSGRRDCGNFLSWPREDGGDVFRSMLAHPKLIPILNELCGEGHRLDHKPVLFTQLNGAEGFDLHGGAVKTNGKYDFPISYHVHANHIVCNLINVAVQLTDSPRGAGGFVVVPGSHKANFPYPDEKDKLQWIADTYGYQPECMAGDVVIFTEAVLHGAAIRLAEQERRVALIRFSPATCAYARGYLNNHSEFIDSLTDAQKAVVAPPYHVDLERPVPAGSDSAVILRPRRSDKKAFDQVVFKHDYY
jgi:ectoine hydroxylase-related dioxygenase (phytanoyl-CoA dioxygenase family)